MAQLIAHFIAIGLTYLIAFFVISFAITVLALRIGGKSAKPETGTWLNALKAAGLMFVISAALSFLGGYLQSKGLTTQTESLKSIFTGLASLIGLLALVANIFIIKKIFDLTVGETVKAVLITLLVDGLLQAVLIGIFVVLFFGTFFKMATQSITAPKSEIATTEETSRPKLPKLPSKPETSENNERSCENHSDCNKVDELCVFGVCQSLDEIKQTNGFTDDPLFDPCLNRPCPNCKTGFQSSTQVSYSAPTNYISSDVCADCLFAESCNDGFRCIDLQCVDTATHPDCKFSMDCGKGYQCKNKLCVKVNADEPPADPESVKRDDERISKLNDFLAKMQGTNLVDLAFYLAEARAYPCQSKDEFPLQPKNFSFDSVSCDTVYIKTFSDGLIMAVGVENAAKANFDTQKLPSPLPDSVKSISPLLGPVSSDTPSQNLVYLDVFEQPGLSEMTNQK